VLRVAVVVIVGVLFVTSLSFWIVGYCSIVVPVALFGVLLFSFFVERGRLGAGPQAPL
jgi:hypothetical protein